MEQMANLSLTPGGEGPGNQLPDIIQSQEQLNQQMKDGLGEGEMPKDGEKNGRDGEQGEKLKEELSGELFEIFKQQQLLKQQLQDKLREAGMDRKNADLLKEMERVEQELLNKGFNAETLKRMNNIVHRLMQLEDALLEQEEEERRTSRTNLENYQNNTKDQIIKAKEYFKTTEILNRQTLPLREIYKTKVKQYFEGDEN
jgi:phosphoenolpyruvate synthase/pyruvate phosphate dikinase